MMWIYYIYCLYCSIYCYLYLTLVLLTLIIHCIDSDQVSQVSELTNYKRRVPNTS